METTGSGIFSMSVIQKILNTESLEEAKRLATDAVAKISESGKKIKQENIRKAKVMIEKSKTPKNIAFGMSNFILAFQGEKVIK